MGCLTWPFVVTPGLTRGPPLLSLLFGSGVGVAFWNIKRTETFHPEWNHRSLSNGKERTNGKEGRHGSVESSAQWKHRDGI